METFVPGELADEEAMEKRGRKITETVIERGEKDNISVILLRTWPKPDTDKESEVKNIRMITNEIMFYGGIVTAATALVTGIICLLALKMKKIKLNAQLDAEYGEEII